MKKDKKTIQEILSEKIVNGYTKPDGTFDDQAYIVNGVVPNMIVDAVEKYNNQTETMEVVETAQFNQLAAICSRYAKINEQSKNACNAITSLRFEIFDDFITKEESDILLKAQNITNRINNKTGKDDAMRYFIHAENTKVNSKK